MRYFVLPREGLSDDMRAALSRGLGLCPLNTRACERHCERYGVADVSAFFEELSEAQAVIATAKMVGAPILVDWCGQLCYDLPEAPDDEVEAWRRDDWLERLFGETAGGTP